MSHKSWVILSFVIAALLLSVLVATAQGPKPKGPAVALGSGFTYQGQVKRNNVPVNELCTFTFTLWDAQGSGSPPTGGTQLGITQSVSSVNVLNGLFTVQLNGAGQFGASAFNGSDRWLQAAVQCASDGSPITLTRQQLSATPYALYSIGNWSLLGNANTTAGTNFLGTSDNQALELKVNNMRALRLEPATGTLGPFTITSPNLIGGLAGNSVVPGVVGATIGGGGIIVMTSTVPITLVQIISGTGGTIGGGFSNVISDTAGTIGGGSSNLAGRNATVGGGIANSANGQFATVGGGQGNTAGIVNATVAGGALNTASGSDAAIGGGYENTIVSTTQRSAIGGGEFNIVSGNWATIPGGSSNVASGAFSFAAGDEAVAAHDGDFVWADSTGTVFTSTQPNQFLIRANGFVGINTNNPSRDLTISSNSTFVTGIDMYNTTTATGTAGYRMQVNGSGVTRPGNFELWLTNLLMTIDAGGNVGLGVTPVDRLTLPNNPDATGRGLANAWNTYSSRRWKTNIATIDDALGKIERLRGVTFDWTANGKPDIGLVAEEVGQVVPEVVTYESNGTDAQSVDYSRLVALLIEAVKQQQGEIAQQQQALDALRQAQPPAAAANTAIDAAPSQQVAQLRAQNEALAARVTALEQQRPTTSPTGSVPGEWLMLGMLLINLVFGIIVVRVRKGV